VGLSDGMVAYAQTSQKCGDQECACTSRIQGSGVAILMFSEMVKALLAKGNDWADLSLTSADNPRTPALAERIGEKIYKRCRVYRLVF